MQVFDGREKQNRISQYQSLIIEVNARRPRKLLDDTQSGEKQNRISQYQSLIEVNASFIMPGYYLHFAASVSIPYRG